MISLDHDGRGHPDCGIRLQQPEFLVHLCLIEKHDAPIATQITRQRCHRVGTVKVLRLEQSESQAVLEKV